MASEIPTMIIYRSGTDFATAYAASVWIDDSASIHQLLPITARFLSCCFGGEGDSPYGKCTSRDSIGVLNDPRRRPQLSHETFSHCVVFGLSLTRILE